MIEGFVKTVFFLFSQNAFKERIKYTSSLCKEGLHMCI